MKIQFDSSIENYQLTLSSDELAVTLLAMEDALKDENLSVEAYKILIQSVAQIKSFLD